MELTKENIKQAFKNGLILDENFWKGESSSYLKSNALFMKYAIKEDSQNIMYAEGSALTKANIKLALKKGLKLDENFWKKASSYIKSNALFMKYAINENPKNIIYAEGNAITKENIKLTLKYGFPLDDEFWKDELSTDLKSNALFMKYAIKVSPEKLMYAEGNAVTDENIELALKEGLNLKEEYIIKSSSDLKSNALFMKYAIKKRPLNITYAEGNAITKENIELALKKRLNFKKRLRLDNNKFILCLTSNLKSNALFMEYAIRENPLNILVAKDEAITEENVKLALKEGLNLKEEYIIKSSSDLKSNALFMKYAIKKRPLNIKYAGLGALTKENIELAFENGLTLDKTFWGDDEYSLHLLKSNALFMEYAIRKNPENIKYACRNFNNWKLTVLTKENIDLAFKPIYENNKIIDFAGIKPSIEEIDEYKNLFENDLAVKYLTMQDIRYVWFTNEKTSDDTIKYLESLNGDNTLLIEKFKSFILKDEDYRKFLKDILLNNLNSLELYDDIDNICKKLYHTNSTQIFNLKYQLAYSLVNVLKENKGPDIILNQINEIFLKNNLPDFAKYTMCFKIIYPNFEKKDINTKTNIFDFGKDTRMSYQLSDEGLTKLITERPFSIYFKAVKNIDRDEIIDYINQSEENKKEIFTEARFLILFNDMLNIAIKSNNRSLREYIENIEKGNALYLGIISGEIKKESLTKEHLEILDVFSEHLKVLYDELKIENKDLNLDGLDSFEKIEKLSKYFNPNSLHDIPDRIVSSFCYFAGYRTLSQLKKTMENSVELANLRGEKRALELTKKPFEMEEGDLIRGFGCLDVLHSTLNGGNVCKELLGTIRGSSSSDTTPLDTDWSYLIQEDISKIKNNKYNKQYFKKVLEIASATGFEFGNLFFIIKKDNPALNISRNNQGVVENVDYDPSKLELFSTSNSQGNHDFHWGIRSGTGICDIDYIVYNNNSYWNNKPNELNIIKIEIAKNGVYVPVLDIDRNLIYTKNEFENLRKLLGGLKTYGEPEFIVSHNLNMGEISFKMGDNEINIPSISSISESLIEDDPKRFDKKQKIQKVLYEFIEEEMGINNIYDYMTKDVSKKTVELLDIGSTSRGTSVPGDCDFDFRLRMDYELIEEGKVPELIQKLKEKLSPCEIVQGAVNRFRGKNIEIEGIEEPVEIDVTFAKKTKDSEYSTEVSLDERLETIIKDHEKDYPLIRANIVAAKMLLKQAGAYKGHNSDSTQSGMGGIGVENWILQHNGSLYDAAKSFTDNCYDKEGNLISFEDFQRKYSVFDMGKNHEASDYYPYDNFIVRNMRDNGYKKTAQALKKYVYEVEKKKELSFPNIINRLEQTGHIKR